MATIRGLYNRVKAFDAAAAAQRAMADTVDDLMVENKAQLFDGKLRDGNDLSPTYLTDPYFKSPLAAQRYSDWKDTITPNSNRKRGVPNLFIDGTFYRSWSIGINGDMVRYQASFSESGSILAKFGALLFGLGGLYKRAYLQRSLRPSFSKQVYLGIGLLPKIR